MTKSGYVWMEKRILLLIHDSQFHEVFQVGRGEEEVRQSFGVNALFFEEMAPTVKVTKPLEPNIVIEPPFQKPPPQSNVHQDMIPCLNVG